MADRQSFFLHHKDDDDDGEPGEVSIGDGEGHHDQAVGEVGLEQDGAEHPVAEVVIVIISRKKDKQTN